MEIFKLVGSVMVDTADAEKSIQKTSDQTEGLGKKLGNGVKTAAKWGAAVAGAALAAGAAMVKAAKDTAAELDVIDKGSARMGITAESYQELAYAAGLCGVEMSTMEKAAKKLEGTDLNLDDALNQIMSLGTESERTQAAIDLFGESIAYQMEPFLQSGADGLAQMKDEAHALGLVMDGETVKSGAAMNDMFSKVEQSLGTLKTSLMSELMPYIQELLQFVIDHIPEIKAAISGIVSTVKTVVQTLAPIVEPVLSALGGIIKSFFALINGDTSTFIESFKSAFLSLGDALAEIGKSIMKAFWNALNVVWGEIVDWFKGQFDQLRNIGGSIKSWFSHAGGIPYVPYDNYPAMLHRGETVLNASDTSELMAAIKGIGSGSGSGDSSPINITIQSVLDGKVIGESVTTYQRNKARAYG